MIELVRGALALSLAPEIGGSVSALSLAGHDVLRPASGEDLAHARVLGMSAFPLVPFAGRIRQGRFRFRGRDVRLPAGLPGEPHAIHGQGWQQPWRTAGHSATSARLHYDHEPGAWPWRYRAVQQFSLLENGLRLDLSLHNRSDTAMPAGLGWHPYFVRPVGTALQAAVHSVWRNPGGDGTAQLMPLDPSCDLRSWRDADDLDLDDVFASTDAGAGAGIRWPGMRARLHGRPAPWLVVYAPPGAPWFCVEPLSHAPDAVNHPEPMSAGLRVLEPGALQALRIELELIPEP